MLRRVALTAALAALLAPAGAAEAAKKKKVKQPVVTSVTPMSAEVGDTMTIRGRNFLKGKGRNTVVFRRSGGKAVFVKADVATPTRLYVELPDKLVEQMVDVGTGKSATVFQIRVLAKRFGKGFTAMGKSPKIAPDTPKAAVTPTSPPPNAVPPAAAPSADCDGDGALNKDENDDDNDGLTDDVELSLSLDPCKVDTDGDGVLDKWEFDCDRNGTLNRDQADDDSDLMDDGLEARIMTDPCSSDTDGDGVEDGYEYKSAIDLNDDEYQQPNTSLPYPSKRPYPNPLDGTDANLDFDGDVLTLTEEFKLWKYTYEVNGTSTRTLSPLSYSDGLQHSIYARCGASNPVGSPCRANGYDTDRRYPTQKAQDYAPWWGKGTETTAAKPNVCPGRPCDQLGFLEWARINGYRNVVLRWVPEYAQSAEVDILDVNLDGDVSDWNDENTNLNELADDYPDKGVRETGEEITAELYPFDHTPDFVIADDERDEDADGLSNYDETHGRMSGVSWWSSCYSAENKYTIEYAGTSHVDADSDGDGVRDGADDQDHDDLPNIMELSRVNASGLDDTENGVTAEQELGPDGTPVGPEPEPDVGNPGIRLWTCKGDQDLPKFPETWHPMAYGWVNPFNPCLPRTDSRTCQRHPSFENAPAPFGQSPYWWSLN